MWIVSFVPVNGYIARLLCILAGTAVLGFGIALSVTANVIMNSGEAFVKAISDVTDKAFGNVKIIFDVSCVLIAVILSLIFFGGKIEGTREGTVIAAFLTGITVKIYIRFVRKPLDTILKR